MPPERSPVTTRTFAVVGQLDLTNAALLSMVLPLTGLTTLPIILACMAARVLAWVIHLNRLLAPIRAWERRSSEVSDHELAATMSAVDAAMPRFFVGYGIAWAASVLLAIGLPLFAPGHSVGTIEWIAVCLILLGVLPSTFAFIAAMLDEALLDTRVALGAELLARGIHVERPVVELARRNTLINVAVGCGGLIAVFGIGLHVRAEGIRAEALAELRGEVAVLSLQPAQTKADLAFERVTLEQLPLTLQLDEAEPGRATGVYERRAETATAAAPTADGSWVIATREVDQHIGWVLLFLAIVVPGSTFPVILLSRALGRVTMLPLTRLREAASQIAQGGELASLTRIVPVHNDELGRLALAFNEMVDILDELSHAAASVATGDLSVELDRPGDLHDAFRGMLDHLRAVVTQIRTTSVALATAAAEIQAAMQEQELAAGQQSEGMLNLDSLVGNLASSAREINGAADAVRGDAERALETTELVLDRIAELTSHASSVGELTELIREVADRSDLLALNGALEATRAGDAGRGFALVASEMRRLAERVTGTVDDVRERVINIEASGASTSEATQESRALARNTASAARDISSLTLEQSKDTTEASLGVKRLAEMVLSTSAAVGQTRAAASGLSERATELQDLISDFRLEA